MRDLIVYEFVFVDEDGRKMTKDIWAGYETEAWSRADDIAYDNGYVDYYLKEDEQEETKMKDSSGIILTQDLNRIFTEVVSGYIANGFSFFTSTMSGHQGEIAKVDLTDGADVYRVIMDRTHEDHRFSGNDDFWGDIIAIEVRRYEGKGVNSRRLNDFNTLWNGDGEQVSVRNFYDISGRGQAWSEDRDYARACETKRYRDRGVINDNECVITDFSHDDRIFLRSLAKKTRGYRSVKLSEIESLIKVINPYSGSRSYRVRFTKDSGLRELTVKTA